MSEFIKTLFEEKEKLDEICHIEEQQRKKIQKHLDTLTDDQVREMSFEDKVLLKEKYGFFIGAEKFFYFLKKIRVKKVLHKKTVKKHTKCLDILNF